jgi:nucleoside-diphosphate-sugar epimerase
MSKLSVFGSTGFIGGTFCDMFSEDVIKIPREQRNPKSQDILYFISTTSNYNVFDDLHLDVNTNLSVLLDVLEFCKDNNVVFNYVSTGFVYGSDIIDAKENDVCDPKGFYSITKRTAEQLLISFCETFHVKYRIMRIANVYGQDKTVSSKKNVLGFLVGLMKENKPITLYDDGMQLRDYMHVTDVCRAIKLIVKNSKYNQIYNIASGNPLPFKHIIEKVKKILDSRSEFIFVDTPEFNKIAQAKNFSLNVDKLKSLGFEQNISLEEGLQSICL